MFQSDTEVKDNSILEIGSAGNDDNAQEMSVIFSKNMSVSPDSTLKILPGASFTLDADGVLNLGIEEE